MIRTSRVAADRPRMIPRTLTIPSWLPRMKSERTVGFGCVARSLAMFESMAGPSRGTGKPFSTVAGLELSNPFRIVDACLGKPRSPRPRRGDDGDCPPNRRRSCDGFRSDVPGRGDPDLGGLHAPRSVPPGSPRPCERRKRATRRHSGLPPTYRRRGSRRPRGSTTATLGSEPSSRRRSGSSRTRRWSGSATPSLNAENETDEEGFR